jgi:hypothetical protein
MIREAAPFWLLARDRFLRLSDKCRHTDGEIRGQKSMRLVFEVGKRKKTLLI